MLPIITLRNVGSAAIAVGLLVAVLTLGTSTDRPFVLAVLLVLVGTGLRLEAAIRARNVPGRGGADR
ncbi:hypothetical protein O7626_23575 [Micromonospora sp. WMMD1102]|uniref:hypothetical protein n=1 Tax=Micromonospora sp. WMMD1102 TaxID=3016105 RepID=UPI0024151408|nr:hypothetical protein [Micromonospora sp. WMMD1102]MDG4788869.1 hypothetical protein [Micromonospora sp. WMMD1102]